MPNGGEKLTKSERKELKEVRDKCKYKVAQLKLKYEGVISDLKS